MTLDLKFIDGEMSDKTIQVELSTKAAKALKKRNKPLFVTMEVYFSCFVVKRVQFSETEPEWPSFEAGDNLNLSFRVIQSAPCNIHDLKGDNTPEYIEFPIKKRRKLLPHRLTIDFVNGEWQGSYIWNFRQSRAVA
ncbi:MAG: hypothetical protein DWQ02_08825 [Bacteroidetes bacterium]|nr:MAG: hypothetical protein DWQ02_08825 [Bacteroidota bacterium]